MYIDTHLFILSPGSLQHTPCALNLPAPKRSRKKGNSRRVGLNCKSKLKEKRRYFNPLLFSFYHLWHIAYSEVTKKATIFGGWIEFD